MKSLQDAGLALGNLLFLVEKIRVIAAEVSPSIQCSFSPSSISQRTVNYPMM